jgi:para-aminobenzoate synthetase/4-amino-4-deoxychorismate lyase
MKQSASVVLQDPSSDSGWLRFTSPRETLVASRLSQVPALLAAVESGVEEGLYAAGFVSYEAAPAFDPALRVRPANELPLAWFGLFSNSQPFDFESAVGDSPLSPLPWAKSISARAFKESVRDIQQRIARGHTYQVNYTFRLLAPFNDDPWRLFSSLCRGQRTRCSAYVDTGAWAICSVSPELFFSLAGDRIRCRPMKGTAPRGRFAREDDDRASWLRVSPKNRAENIMIVDMVRNDLGRIAQPDSIRVSHLCNLERYPSVLQLTSTVEAVTQATLGEVFAALFPSASVTGAPKVRSMEIIAELEDRPRGAYTGAVGYLAPNRRARFNVAIRTVQIDRCRGWAEFGTGGGIVWDSSATEEWLECRTKALILSRPMPRFELLETLLWEPSPGYYLLERHLSRLSASARYFGFRLDLEAVRRRLEELGDRLPDQPHRVRLLVGETGKIALDSTPLTAAGRQWRVALARSPVSSRERFLFHKTTYRKIYDEARHGFPNHDDIILWNEHDEVTESCVANVVVRLGDRLITPALDCGLLPGTLRAELLAGGKIEEGRVALADLERASELYLINSVRGWITACLDRPATRPAETRHGQDSYG